MGYYDKLKPFLNLAFRSKKLSFALLKKSLLSYLGFNVCAGPFKGMKYITASNGSVLIPKITGTYECELHSTIIKILNNHYDYLVDIGCAEGYYAVGFAVANKRNSSFRVYAYDTDNEALNNLKDLATLNGVEKKIHVKDLFNHRELKSLDQRKAFIICDIEGGERDLLNPEQMPELLNFDILVEVHDGKGSSIIKDLLVKRFQSTHFIDTIKYQGENDWRKNYMPWVSNRDFIKGVLDEGRKYGLDWLYIKKK